jgi:large subunit ribosomal protein L28
MINLNFLEKSVCQICVKIILPNYKLPFKNLNAYDSAGSGLFITEDIILTCSHVVENASFITIKLPETGSIEYKCEVLGICPKFDIALIKVIDNYKSKYICNLENNQENIYQGSDVFVIGFPLGFSNRKITKGVISGQQFNKYQIDAPTNGGNSGGPVFLNNKVIGIVVSTLREHNGKNVNNTHYVVPIQLFFNIQNLLLKKNYLVHYPEVLGFYWQNTTNLFKKMNLIHNFKDQGILITDIVNNSLISQTNLKINDILFSIGGYIIDNFGFLNKTWLNQKLSVNDLTFIFKLNEKIEIIYFSMERKKIIKEYFIFKEFKFQIRELFHIFEPQDYIIWAGLILAPYSLNYIEISKNDQSVHLNYSKYLFFKNRNDCKITIINIFKGSMIDNYKFFNLGLIITHVNNMPIENMNDLRIAIAFNKSKISTIKAENNETIYLKNDDIQKEFLELSKIYLYDSEKESQNIYNVNYPLNDAKDYILHSISKVLK